LNRLGAILHFTVLLALQAAGGSLFGGASLHKLEHVSASAFMGGSSNRGQISGYEDRKIEPDELVVG
jgi:hypothetical protein